MNDIICPHCNKAFKIDETGYADIVKQVRDSEFDQQLHDRLALAEKEKLTAVELATVKAASALQKAAAEKDSEIQALQSQLKSGDDSKALAVSQAVSKLERERDALANQLAQAKREMQAASELSAAEQRLALNEAISKVEKERDGLKSGLDRAAMEKQVAEAALRDKYETQIKDRDDAIERLRDMKAKLSTKMVGETLEQHCETEFNRIRATAFGQPHSRAPTSRKTTTHAQAVRATTSLRIQTRRGQRLCSSCLR